eukprot:CAMPEP_0118932532 /NCGR_PEP_ID=MMETSP1169-20130426/10477_1 /TAXON_ID=36882 /ORGANISM="Pyramimonas obovata, Strain CCMP722" /LENGTH=73 /DNA_ID=CAMNT_0006875201 /DNA_START=47 /DNA_END=268 /DNA_ORIENTATION=+
MAKQLPGKGKKESSKEKRERRFANAKAREAAFKYVWPVFIAAFVLVLIFVAVYANRGGFKTPEERLLSEDVEL